MPKRLSAAVKNPGMVVRSATSATLKKKLPLPASDSVNLVWLPAERANSVAGLQQAAHQRLAQSAAAAANHDVSILTFVVVCHANSYG